MEKIKAGRFFSLKFDELTGCKGKRYTFELTVEQCEKDTQVIVYAVPGASKDSLLVVKGEKADGVMVLRTVTHLSLIHILKERMLILSCIIVKQENC